jgi:ubiquitin-activating enzyme E1
VSCEFSESYNDDKEVEQQDAIPSCTLKDFPYRPEHCIEWARQKVFDAHFIEYPTLFNTLLKERASFVSRIRDADDTWILLRQLKSLIKAERTFASCIGLAFEQFHALFNFKIFTMITNLPRDHKVGILNSAGETIGETDFWVGEHRFPEVCTFNSKDSLHVDFLFALANLFAFEFGIAGMSVADRDKFDHVLAQTRLTVPPYVLPPKPGTEEEAAQIEALIQELETCDISGCVELKVASFEKDDDQNFHIDFITAASNLRAWNFHIPSASRFQCLMTAGRIIPALCTTTAMIAGMASLEFYKIMKGMHASTFFGSQINLGISAFNVFNPSPPTSTTSTRDAQGSECPVLPGPWGIRKPGDPMAHKFCCWDQMVCVGGWVGVGVRVCVCLCVGV